MTVSGIADSAKNASVVLAALSAMADAAGYIVVRARARALGTDPGFALIDQAYVFGGFRFVLMLLFALLVTAPMLLLLHWIGRLTSLLEPGPLCAVETIAVVAAGMATIWAYVATIGVSGVLLAPSTGWIADAVLQRNNFGTLMVLATTALSAAVLLWTDAHIERTAGFGPLGLVLLLIAALLLVLLPMQHGVFYADRTARRLGQVPEGATGLAPPVWLVDRGAGDRVVLYGRAADGQPQLLTLKADRLHGIPVIGVSTLGMAVGERGQ